MTETDSNHGQVIAEMSEDSPQMSWEAQMSEKSETSWDFRVRQEMEIRVKKRQLVTHGWLETIRVLTFIGALLLSKVGGEWTMIIVTATISIGIFATTLGLFLSRGVGELYDTSVKNTEQNIILVAVIAVANIFGEF